MTQHTYQLDVDGMNVLAVIGWNGANGVLFCSYDDRSTTIQLGSQPQYLREDARRVLKSRRALTRMGGQAKYSRKDTCRAIANRLDLLVTQERLTEAEAQEVLTEINGKWRGLQTEHDFQRFADTNIIAKQELSKCLRVDEDFEAKIADPLCRAIKLDLEAEQDTGVTTRDDGLVIVQAATAKVNEVLAFHDLPTGDTFVAGVDSLDEAVADLRECLGESDDLASDRLTALRAANEVLAIMLDERGVPTSEHIGDNLRSVAEYLSAVEGAAKSWQERGLVWQRHAQDDADMLINEALTRTFPRTVQTGPAPRDLVEVATNTTTAGLVPVFTQTYLRRPLMGVALPPNAVKIEKGNSAALNVTGYDAAGEEVEPYTPMGATFNNMEEYVGHFRGPCVDDAIQRCMSGATDAADSESVEGYVQAMGRLAGKEVSSHIDPDEAPEAVVGRYFASEEPQ